MGKRIKEIAAILIHHVHCTCTV